ncbi:MAG: hypothetical protein RLZ98_557 [Pseudomonadota bacterium]|jgi:cytochrome b pre-mRNA-processing protein 3
MWNLFQTRSNRSDTATKLYGRVVAQAREPGLYAVLGLPDTPEGRYEAIVLHLVFVGSRLSRLGSDGHALARAVNECFVTDMDDSLREMGVGDLTVPKKVKRAAAGLYERSGSYLSALATGSAAKLALALEEQMGAGMMPTPAVHRLAEYALQAHALLDGQDDGALLSGSVGFPPVN